MPGEVAHGPAQDRDPGQPHGVERLCVLPGQSLQAAQRPAQGEGRADQQGGGMGIGAVVHPRRVGAGNVDERHRERGQRGGRPGHPGPDPAALAGLEHDDQQQRPHQVELFLDAERPQVLQRVRRPELREVGLVPDLPPVAGVRHRPEQCLPQRGQLARLDDGRRRGHGDQQHGQRREQPARPPRPERAQPQAAVPVPLGDQQIRDQVPAEHEKDVNAEEAPGKRRELLMKGDNGKHGQRAQPVQPRRPRGPRGRSRTFHWFIHHHSADTPGSEQCSDAHRFNARRNAVPGNSPEQIR